MSKRVYSTSTFGGYLHELRKGRNIGFDEFRNSLGVSKAYLNDVETGSCRPPTPEIQVKMVMLLSSIKELSAEESTKLYSLAAKGRNELPADILGYLRSDDGAVEAIRLSDDYKKYWQKRGL